MARVRGVGYLIYMEFYVGDTYDIKSPNTSCHAGFVKGL